MSKTRTNDVTVLGAADALPELSLQELSHVHGGRKRRGKGPGRGAG